MFNVGGPELVVLGILALLVFGPEGLPGIIKTVMGTIRALKVAASDFQAEVRSAIDEESLRLDTQKRVRKPDPTLQIETQKQNPLFGPVPPPSESSLTEPEEAEDAVEASPEVAIEPSDSETAKTKSDLEQELDPSETSGQTVEMSGILVNEPDGESADTPEAQDDEVEEEDEDDYDGPSLPMVPPKEGTGT